MYTRSLLAIGIAAALGACSSMPERNTALEQAQSHFAAAQSNAIVTSLAADELKRAGDALRLAEQARAGHGSHSEIDHLSYLADQRVTIAVDTASSRDSQRMVAAAAGERDRVRLEARTNEVNEAHWNLAQAERRNAESADALEASAARERAARASSASSAEALADVKANAQADAEASAARERAARASSAQTVLNLEAQLRALNAKQTARGMVVTLGDVLFDTGQSKVLRDGGENMSKLSEVFRSNPQLTATIEGYTDNVGSDDSNHALSGRRANAVKDALVHSGIGAERLKTVAHGEESPAADNGTATGRQLNRRVEVVFAGKTPDVTMK